MNRKGPILYSGGCGRTQRRMFLADFGMGFTGLVLGAMLHQDGVVRANTQSAWTPPDGKPHFPPKAKSVIWLFMQGGVSHLDTFDPKPALNKYDGKTILETPYRAAVDSPLLKKNVVLLVEADLTGVFQSKIMAMQTGYKKHGQSGLEISDWWPHVAECADDLALIRSMWTTDFDHVAGLQFHQGRRGFDGYFPTIGAWVHYGLGALNENLPQFVVLGTPPFPGIGGNNLFGATYLGASHAGVRLEVDPENPLPYAFPDANISREQQEREFEFLGRLNHLDAVKYPTDEAMRARIKSYELAFRMQSAVPEVFRFQEESPATHKLYGLDNDITRPFGQVCLTARRLVERGVRFVQVFHGNAPGSMQLAWDSHSELRKNHTKACLEVDQPIGALLKDLKQRGMLDETLVVWGTEFGRTPGIQGGNSEQGRNHHTFGFSVWMAGGGIKGGIAHGATDELGFHAVENRHYVTDIHATVLHQLGLDPRRLEVPGQKRLEIEVGEPIKEIMA